LEHSLQIGFLGRAQLLVLVGLRWEVEGVAPPEDVSDSTAGHDLNLSTAKPQFNGQLDGLAAPDLQRNTEKNRGIRWEKWQRKARFSVRH